jgi:glycosyltransferase involved in cell wall biosynthesis
MVNENGSHPLVSVIIPAYNHEKFIGAAVDSVLSQSITDLELIVINDGSTDQTGEIVQNYTDKRMTYYYQENRDAYNTINRGLGLAKGKYIAILNSDDVFTSNRLERLLKCQEDTCAKCIITDVIPLSDSGEEFTDPEFGWNIWHQKNRNYYFECGDIYTAFLKGNFMVTTSNLFMTAEAMTKTGEFCSLRYLHDYDYIFRLMLSCPGKVHYLAGEKLLYYRIHSGNTLGEAAITGREQDQELIKKYMLKRIPEEYSALVAAGSDRLVELEKELYEVKSVMSPVDVPGVRPAAKMLQKSLKAWIKKQRS